MTSIELTINGERVVESSVSPTTTLLEYLRGPRGLTGTKEGCAEGDCGACTVALRDGEGYRAVNSCLVLLPMVHGQHVVTVEGLARGEVPHPVQRALVERLGSQCGYCTPGVVMSMFEACHRRDLDAAWKLDDQLCGNLCRCTGYRPIREATAAIAGLGAEDPYAGLAPSYPSLDYRSSSQRFVRPSSFDELWSALDSMPAARFVAGGTDLSLEVTKRFLRPPALISLEGLAALRGIEPARDGWRIGATTSLAELEAAASERFPSITRMLRFFGSRQIKNRGTVGGNLMNASPIGDLAPVLLALGAEAILRSRDGERRVPLDAFFVDYRRTAAAPGELLAAVFVPYPPEDARIVAYKVSKRQELDISAVAAGMFVALAGDRVAAVRLAFGGMAKTPARARRTEARLLGGRWDEAAVEAAVPALDGDFAPISDHRGSAWYRSTVAKNLLRAFALESRAPIRALPHRPAATVLVEAP